MATTERPADVVLGMDLGGTKVAAALVDEHGQMHELRIKPRPIGDDLEGACLEFAREMVTAGVRAIGVGAAGLVEADAGMLVWGPNVQGRHMRFRDVFERELELPTAVDNDATLAGLAETRMGAAVGYHHVEMITIGTGIGGGWMIDGRRCHGAGFAGEIGHVILDVEGPRCACGQRGCWETLVSGTRLDRAARDLVATDPGGKVAKLTLDATVTGRHLTEATIGGDHQAIGAIAEIARWLGIGIANLVVAFDPEIVVIGGGVARAGELLLEPARQAFNETLSGADHRKSTPIVAATLGEHAGVVSAGLLAWEEC